MFLQIVMSKEFESLDQPLMVEVIRLRQSPQSSRSLMEPQLEELTSGRTLKEDLRRFLQATTSTTESSKEWSIFSDVSLALGDDVIRSHRSILAARSSYFEASFFFIIF